jgi:hypothetical protein
MEITDSEKIEIVISRISDRWKGKDNPQIDVRALAYFLYEEVIKKQDIK